ncbi:MAG: T9SS type A sorting domain-containing protein [Candidatus Marinimicrobia bacterium]|nr:T9SS type A sorting domain-containing protein [Candidatus Neomarinimicrobiota bacterium]
MKFINNIFLLFLLFFAKSFIFSQDRVKNNYTEFSISSPIIHTQVEGFGDRQDWGELEYNPIDEASGIVASRKNENVFWVHNDSGDQNRIYAFNSSGEHLGVYYLDGCTARDWEDMCTGPGPIEGESYLYIGNIGDNDAQYNLKYIYRVIEPVVNSEQIPITETIYGADIITYQYPNGNRDAETLMLDPLTKDIYIISKREEPVHVYRLAYPQSTTETVTPELMIDIDFFPNIENSSSQYIVAGDISEDGLEVLVKSYNEIFYFSRTSDQALWEVFNHDLVTIPYISEVQGEAIAWHPQGYGYFTTSEEKYNTPAHLYFYPDLLGCTDSTALNFNTFATDDDGSCEYLGLDNQVNFESFALDDAYPNPFNARTTLRFTLFEQTMVFLQIFDLNGKLVNTLLNQNINEGFHEIHWNGSNTQGVSVSTGPYFYRIQAGDQMQIRKILLIK